MSPLPPPSPLFEHRPGLWIKESWLRFSGLLLQTRMVVIRVDGGLALYSPSPAALDESLLAELRARGKPRWLIAPNEIHNVGLPAFQAAFPNAHTTGCLGHPRRVKGVNFDVLLDETSKQEAVPWTQSAELQFHVIGGNGLLHEIALFHRPSRTLLLTDAVEWIDPNTHLGKPPGALMRWGLSLSGLRECTACMSPEHQLLCVDPDALEASYRVLDSWDFDSLVISHGRIFEGPEAREAVRSAFENALRHIRRRGPIRRTFWKTLSRFA